MNKETKPPEPLAAILAEMREFCSGWSEDVDVTVKVGLIYGWACRLKAAAERERAITDVMLAVKDKPLPHPDPEHAPPLYPGNAAAMRAALEEQLRYWNSVVRTRDEEGMRKRTEAALAAPARNCDRTKDNAEELFKERFGRPWTQTEDELAAFLFAPAEGGDHA